jgi:hypothetical protein
MQTDEHEQYLKDCLSIVPEAIQDEFVRIPADLGYWNAQFADAQRRALRGKATEKQVRASTYLRIKSAAVEKGTKLTEAALDASVEADEEVLEAVYNLVEAEADKARLYGVVDAVRCKREMLISLGNFLRVEMEGDPSLRNRVRDSKLVRGDADD